MTAIDTAFALVIASLLGCIGFFVALAVRARWNETHPNEMAMCTPTRRANITANTTQAQRRMLIPLPTCAMQAAADAQLPPDMAWDDELQGWAPPKPQPRQQAACCSPSRYDVEMMQRQFSITYDLAAIAASNVVPDELPIAVDDWPVPVVDVEPEPVPVVVGWAAARFAALEIEREVQP